MTRPLDAVLAIHRLAPTTQCGAISMPVVHHHGSESEQHPGPKRSLTCTEDVGHEGRHRDAICCYNFQQFDDWQVAGRVPRVSDLCSSCQHPWPCATIRAIQEAVS